MKNEHKVLGLNWDCVSDEFIFKFEALLKLAEGLELTSCGGEYPVAVRTKDKLAEV